MVHNIKRMLYNISQPYRCRLWLMLPSFVRAVLIKLPCLYYGSWQSQRRCRSLLFKLVSRCHRWCGTLTRRRLTGSIMICHGSHSNHPSHWFIPIGDKTWKQAWRIVIKSEQATQHSLTFARPSRGSLFKLTVAPWPRD